MSATSIKRLEQDVRRLDRRLASIENSTAFKVWRMAVLPIAAVRAALRLTTKTVRQVKPDATLSSRRLRSRAIEIADTDPAAARQLMDAAQPELCWLLQANTATDDASWTMGVNGYLMYRNVDPISLRSGPDPRFTRLIPHRLSSPDGPLITVIMPAFNAEATIDHALRSVRASSWQNLEIIVVDDASTDRTPAIVGEIMQADHRIKLLCNPTNVGPYVSKNRALEIATGDFITGHDADDFALPDGIEGQMAAMTDDVAVSVGRMVRMTAEGRIALGGPLDGAMRTASISALFRADAFREKLGHYDTVRYAADSEIISRAETVFGPAFKHVDVIRMFCLERPDSLTNHPATGHAAGPNRQFYKHQYRAWHARMNGQGGYLPAEHWPRQFPAPSDMIVLPARFEG